MSPVWVGEAQARAACCKPHADMPAHNSARRAQQAIYKRCMRRLHQTRWSMCCLVLFGGTSQWSG